MNEMRKLNVTLLLVIGVPILVGLLLLTQEGTIIQASAFHFYFVLVSAFFSFVLSMMAFKEHQKTKTPTVLMLAIGFLGVSIFYAIHGLITPGYSLFSFEQAQDQLNLFVFSGDLSRLWLAIFVFFSGTYIQKWVQIIGERRFMLGLAMVLILVGVLLIYIPGLVPNAKLSDGTDTQFSILIKVITLTLLGTTITNYYASYKMRPSVSVLFLIIGLSLVFGAVIIFMISTPWGPIWWMAHVLYLLTYLIIGVGVVYTMKTHAQLEYFDALGEVKRYVKRLDETNAQLEILANTDVLTKLPNRAHFIQHLDQMIKHHEAPSFALFFIDIDDFKAINDNYGHQAGDMILKETARRIKSHINPGDLVARFAGDEFIVLMKDCYRIDPVVNAKTLLQTLNEPLVLHEATIKIEVCIGVVISPYHGHTSDELITNSDKAMYHAKKSGKNTVRSYEDLNQ